MNLVDPPGLDSLAAGNGGLTGVICARPAQRCVFIQLSTSVSGGFGPCSWKIKRGPSLYDCAARKLHRSKLFTGDDGISARHSYICFAS